MYNNSTVYSLVCVQLKFWYFLQSSIYCQSCNELPFKQMQKEKELLYSQLC